MLLLFPVSVRELGDDDCADYRRVQVPMCGDGVYGYQAQRQRDVAESWPVYIYCKSSSWAEHIVSACIPLDQRFCCAGN